MSKDQEARARSVREIARDSSGLQSALRRAEAFLALNARLAPELPETLRDQVRVACIEGGTLVIAAGSAAWATQARLHQHALLDAARRHWPQPLDSVKVVIAPGLEPGGLAD